ncbi:hypothetical protein RHGRI_032105 [Rhododendron griersonianum]|uniref:AAA+ ATPase domain-containing protein n=1 Tax=Rhododendron griersonianum TaxID=479676 RepID=A0AAV6IB02_9ERIC|nr:hypothetical protein RHGRI_032105 [Rhododendron griersonianum]
MSEMHNRASVGGGGFDPSNLHLKKELTQIRKAARSLKDPGTTSTWRSPLNSARSAAPTTANAASSSNNNPKFSTTNGEGLANQLPLRPETSNGSSGARERKVFLYNWRSNQQRSKSGRSRGQDGESSDEDDAEGSAEEEEESFSDARNGGGGGDSRSDAHVGDRYASLMMFKCRGSTKLAPSIRRTSIRKKTKINPHLANVLRQQIVKSRSSKQALEGLGRDDNDDEQSDDGTEDYCSNDNSEDLRLLSRLSKRKNWPHLSLKPLRNSGREDSSYTYNSTPALSTGSYNRYGNRNPSTVGSWDATTASFNGGDDDDPLDLPGRQGCGIPCYWSRKSTPKHRGDCGGSYYSPSLSETLRRKGSSILCGSQTKNHKHGRGSTSSSKKRRLISRAAQGVIPLLTNSGDGQGGSSIGNSDDELSTNYGELDLEALSRLDGRRWSCSCRSQEGLELVAPNGDGEGEGESTPETIGSLCQKYRPVFFEEIIGQNIVVQSLMNAISRGRIAHVCLFQGPRGSGKTSTARIFAAALNCLASKESKPCGVCRECADFISGKTNDLIEVDSTSKKGIDRVKHILKNLSVGPSSAFSRYRVFIIDECHLLPSKMWLAFLKSLEEPPSRVVFIFVTADLDNVPRAVLSRCQKYLFNKIKDSDIVARLRKISADEDLDVEPDALDLIALNADGSLRDAETMLDQLSLLGKTITSSLVNELVGVVSDEKLLELLELAMSSDTAETVKRARELMDSGVDPMVIMSQLATLIMDIIAGTYHIIDSKDNNSFFAGRSLNEAELDRLKHALKLLSEAEKQLRVSSERSTWFTATLLQLGSVNSSDSTHSGGSRRQSSKTTEEDRSSASKEATTQKQRAQMSTSPAVVSKAALQNQAIHEDSFLLANGINANPKHTQRKFRSGDLSAVSHDQVMISRCVNSDKLDDIWVRCIGRCHSKTLRQLLLSHGKLISISEVEGIFVAYIAFGERDIKARAERFLSSITNSFETVLRYNVEVRIILLPDDETSLGRNQMDTAEEISRERKSIFPNTKDGYSDIGSRQEPLKRSRGVDSDGKLGGTLLSATGSPIPLAEGNSKMSAKVRNPMQRVESIIHEQRLETAWLQAVEKGTPGSLSRLKPEKNQILPQEGIYPQNQTKPLNSVDLSSQNWEDELNREMKILKINDRKAVQKDQIGKRVDHCPISPSLLHDSTYVGSFSKESMGYESGSGAGGCSGLFCWNNTKPQKKVKVKQGAPVRAHRSARFSWFGECARSKPTERSFRQ